MVTLPLTQENTPCQTGPYSNYLPRRDGRLSCPIGAWFHTKMVYMSADRHPTMWYPGAE